MEPPDPISNSEVKRVIADGSVGPPHVRVGQCQAPHLSLQLNKLKAFKSKIKTTSNGYLNSCLSV